MPINYESRNAAAEGYSPEKITDPYDSKKLVSAEEVRIATETPSFEVNRVELILRMWEEIQDLRNILQKQIY